MSYTGHPVAKAEKLSETMITSIGSVGQRLVVRVTLGTIRALVERGILTAVTSATLGQNLLTAKGVVVHRDLGLGEPHPETTEEYVKANTVIYAVGDTVKCPERPDLSEGVVQQVGGSRYGQNLVVKWSDSRTLVTARPDNLVLARRAGEPAPTVPVKLLTPKVCRECRMPGSHKMDCSTGRYEGRERTQATEVLASAPEPVMDLTTYEVQASENNGASWRPISDGGFRRKDAALTRAELAASATSIGVHRLYRVVERRETVTVVSAPAPVKDETDDRYVVVRLGIDGFRVKDTMSDWSSSASYSRYAANDLAERWNREGR